MSNTDYYAVIFTRRLTSQTAGDTKEYDEMAEEILALARKQRGFIDFNSASDEALGIAISYWKDLQSIAAWKADSQHLQAQKLGKSQFYQDYSLQVCRVERSYNSGDPAYHPRLEEAVT